MTSSVGSLARARASRTGLAVLFSALLTSCSSSGNNAAGDAGPTDASVTGDGAVDAASDGPICGAGGASVPTYTRSAGTTVSFPKGFLFGASTAGLQIETGLATADWHEWANLPGRVAHGDKPDDGPDAFSHFDDDVAALTALHAGAYRFSIEWARIFPTKAAFDAGTPDAAGLAAYHALLAKLKAAHIRPFVTIHHFATPDYLDDITQPASPQVFERPEMQADFVKWATFVGKEFGGEVDDWITINEPLILLVGEYLAGAHPPGATLEIPRMIAAAKMLMRTHAAVYEALHAADTVDAGTGAAANVSLAQHNRMFYPDDACNPMDVAATNKLIYIWNQWLLNALVFGNYDDDLNGDYAGPNDKMGDPTLKGHLDFIGLNYYGDTLVSSALPLDVIGGTPSYENLGTGLPQSDMTWDIFPQGVRPILAQLKPYKLPIYITENGIADSQDINKSRYIGEHLWEVGRSIADDGVDVRGYFYWALIDNFEWNRGFCPKFGLYKVDLTAPTRTRTPTKAAPFFAQIAQTGTLATSAIDALPAYGTPVKCPNP